MSHPLPVLLAVLGCAQQPVTVDLCAEAADLPATGAPNPDPGLIYEVYIRSFQDSDDDGIGDLQGVRKRLGYLADLGVQTLWLMPIFPSPGPAGYDVEGLGRVRADYGTGADLDALIADAEERGIRVVLDAPINHTAVSHPWFMEALEDHRSDRRDAYVFSHEQWDELRWFPAGDDSWYYAYFGEGFPDLDWSNSQVVDGISGDLSSWLDRGVGGFRLDAVRQLVEDSGDISDTELGHCTLEWLYATLAQDDGVILAEAWSDDLDVLEPYLGTEERPQADLALGVPRHLATADAFEYGQAEPLSAVLRDELARGISQRMAGYVGSHDVPRFRDRYPDAAVRRAWMVLLMTLPGAPILYYGDELDLRSGENQDQDYPWRGPMAWTSGMHGGFSNHVPWMAPADDYIDGTNAQDLAEEPLSLLRLVQSLSVLRRTVPAAAEGELALHEVDAPSVLAFERSSDQGARVLVLVNLSDQDLGEVVVRGAGSTTWVELTAEGRLVDFLRGGVSLSGLGYRIMVSEPVEGISVPGPVEH